MPVPWSVSTIRTNFVYADSDLVCICADTVTQDFRANAALIAAAPEMYQALLEAKQHIEFLHKKYSETWSGNQVLLIIEKVIDKATL